MVWIMDSTQSWFLEVSPNRTIKWTSARFRTTTHLRLWITRAVQCTCSYSTLHTCSSSSLSIAEVYFCEANLKVSVVESIDNVPSKHEKLPPLNEQTMEETEGKQQLLVLVFALAVRECLLIDHLVQTLHVSLQALCVCGVCVHAREREVQSHTGRFSLAGLSPRVLKYLGRSGLITHGSWWTRCTKRAVP